MIMLRHRVAWSVAVGLALLGTAAAGYASSSGGGLTMGRSSTLNRQAFQGYYDGHKDTYLNTDVSDKAEATAMHINYAPGLKAVPVSSAPEIISSRAVPREVSSPSSAPSPARRATHRSGKRRSSPGSRARPRC
jgi:hypothetical protein